MNTQHIRPPRRTTVLSRLARTIDLAFRISPRAKRAQRLSAHGFATVRQLYDGGLEVQACDLLPHLLSGKPTRANPFRVVVAAVEDDGHLSTCSAVYLPTEDAFQLHWGVRPRVDRDRWIPSSDFRSAFNRAMEAARERSIGGQCNGG